MLLRSLAASAAAGAGLVAAARVHHAPAGAAHKKQPAARSAAAADEPYHLTLHLAPGRLDALEEHVEQLAGNPASEHWLSHAQVQEYLAPAPAHKDAVRAWLAKQNVTDLHWSPSGDRVSFASTHRDVADKFQAPLGLYSLARNTRVFRAESYTVPDELEHAVESITPLTSFLVPSPRHALRHRYSEPEATRELEGSKGKPKGCSDTFVTMDCIRQHYGSAQYSPKNSSSNSNQTDLLIIGFSEDQAFSQADLTKFLKKYRPDQANYTVHTETLQIANATAEYAGSETMLDLEMAVGIAAPLKVDFLLSGTTGEDQFLAPLQHILDRPNKPGVISVSYGPAESDMTKDDARRWYKTGLGLAAQGTTVVFASGDSGVDEGNESCKSGVKPPWPTTSSILVVGATTGTNPEHAMNPLTDPQENVAAWSGAGWSNLNKAPKWQANISSAYLNALPHNLTRYVNTTGRGIADVSAFGEAIVTVVNNFTQTLAGTSASAPLWAAHLALVNSALQAHGKKNLGFIHPRLYSQGIAQGAVKDIEHGTVCGCPDIQGLCFPSGKGWDPATGLGVPDFEGLLKFFGAA